MDSTTRRPRRFRGGFDPAPRPFVAFAATNRQQALRFYRAQNLIWVWLGIAAILSAAEYFFRPKFGPVIVSSSTMLDIVRVTFFAIGGWLISVGVWTIRRAFEVLGHIFFTTGALLNLVASFSLPSPKGAVIFTAILFTGLAFTSAYRAYFIVRWIGTDALDRD